MKRIWSILFLLVFSFNILGVFFVIRLKQYRIRQAIKREIKHGVNDKDLCAIKISDAEADQLTWFKDHEFRYKGQMYDVVKKVQTCGNTTIYYCISDAQETTLFAHLDELVKKNMDPEKRSNAPIKNLLKLISNLYYKNQVFAFNNTWKENQKTWLFNDHYRMPFPDEISPPPKV